MAVSVKNNSLFEQLFALLALVVCWAKLVGYLRQQMEFRLYDESFYLFAGTRFFSEPLLPEFSPLYSFWYWLIYPFAATKVDLYYLNYYILTLLFPLCYFVFLRAIGLRVWLACIFSIMLLFSGLNLPVWPKVSNLLVSVLLLFCAWLYKSKASFQFKIWASALIAYAFIFMRPEWVSAFLVFLVWWLVLGFKHKKWTLFALQATFLLALVCMSVYAIGWPVGSGPRAMIAFGQHFVHNRWSIAGEDKSLMTWQWVNWRMGIKPYFGDSKTFVEAFFYNPIAMLNHMAYNAWTFALKGSYVLLESLVPRRIFHFSPSVILLLVIGLLEWRKKQKGFYEWIQFGPEVKKLLWFCLAFSVPALAAGLIFQPRAHYILPILPLLGLVVGRLLEGYFSEHTFPKWTSFGIVASFLALGWWFFPDTTGYFALKKTYKPAFGADTNDVMLIDDKSTTLKVQKLNALHFSKPIRILDISTGYFYYYEKPFQHFGATAFELNYDEYEHFYALLQEKEINAVLISETLDFEESFKKNKEWNHFLKHFSEKGFRKVPVSGACYLLVKDR